MITLVREVSGDWIGLYKDGELVMENHSLQEEDVLRAVDVEYAVIHDVDLSDGASLPRKLSDLNINGVAR